MDSFAGFPLSETGFLSLPLDAEPPIDPVLLPLDHPTPCWFAGLVSTPTPPPSPSGELDEAPASPPPPLPIVHITRAAHGPGACLLSQLWHDLPAPEPVKKPIVRKATRSRLLRRRWVRRVRTFSAAIAALWRLVHSTRNRHVASVQANILGVTITIHRPDEFVALLQDYRSPGHRQIPLTYQHFLRYARAWFENPLPARLAGQTGPLYFTLRNQAHLREMWLQGPG